MDTNTVKTNEQPKEEPKKIPAGVIVVDGTKAAMRMAFEFGYRSCEKGMNLEAALASYDRLMKG